MWNRVRLRACAIPVRAAEAAMEKSSAEYPCGVTGRNRGRREDKMGGGKVVDAGWAWSLTMIIKRVIEVTQMPVIQL